MISDTKTKEQLLQEEKFRCIKVGNKVAQKRLEKRISRGDLGKQIGVTKETLRQNESGDVRMSVGRVSQIAECLDESVQVFFEGIGTTPKSTEEMSNLVAEGFKGIKSKSIQGTIYDLVRKLQQSDES